MSETRAEQIARYKVSNKLRRDAIGTLRHTGPIQLSDGSTISAETLEKEYWANFKRQQEYIGWDGL